MGTPGPMATSRCPLALALPRRICAASLYWQKGADSKREGRGGIMARQRVWLTAMIRPMTAVESKRTGYLFLTDQPVPSRASHAAQCSVKP